VETEVAVETAEVAVETAEVAVETAETATTPLKLRPSATQKKLEAEAAARALAEANAEAEAAARAEATARAAAQQAQNEERRRQEEGEKTQTQDARNNGQQTGNGNDTPPRVRDSDKKQKNKHVSFASTVRDEDGTSASLRTPAAPHKPPAKSHTNPPAPRQPQAESHTMRNVAAFMITIIGIAAGIAILLTSGSLLGLIPLIVGVAVGGVAMLNRNDPEQDNNKTNTPTQHHETSRSQNHAATLANQRKVNPPSPSKQP
jgi:hypothetical protein